MDAKTVNKFPIRDYLAAQGIRPAKDNPRYGFYLSPLREERTPSFKVDYGQNLWYDFGLGEGGTLIDLVMRMERCSAGEAMRRLEQRISETPAFSFHGYSNPVPPHHESVITIEQICPLEILPCSLTSRNGASTLPQLVHIVRRCIIVWPANPISPSDSATMPEVGNCATAISRAAPRKPRRPAAAIIRRVSFSRGLWITYRF